MKRSLWMQVVLGFSVTVVAASPARAGDVFVNDSFPISPGNTGGRSTLSPPVISAVNNCATHVYVTSFMPKATVRVILNGTTVIGTATPVFGFAGIALTHTLVTGDRLTATQTVNGFTSAPSSPPVTVGAMPVPLGAPTIDRAIYGCGHVVPVHDLAPGVSVSVEDASAGSAVLGVGFTPNDWGTSWDPVVTSPLVAGHDITATQSACGGPPSPAAAPTPALPEPSPLLAPVLDTPIVGNDAITLRGLYTGATIEAFDHATSIASGYATGGGNWMHVPPIAATASISAQQTLCNSSPRSPGLTPTNRIPRPLLLGPICPNQATVQVRNTTIDATLVLLKNGVVVGNGGAAPGDVPLAIAPPSAFAVADKVSVVEYIGTLVSPTSNVVTVNCAPQNVITQHNDNARTGAQLAERFLTPALVSGSHFGLVYDRHVLGTILAQPLYVHGVKARGSIKNLIYVATAEDVVYAFDADDSSPDTTTNVTVRGEAMAESTKWIWRTSLGAPHINDICGETVPPAVGVTSTPVIDVSAGVMYVVARDQTGSDGMGHDHLHALDIETGADLRHRVVRATNPLHHFVFNDACQRQRPGLLLQGGVVYLGYGTYSCDSYCPAGEPYRGWVMGFRATDLASAGVFTNSQSHDEGGMGVWASGNGLAGSSDGSIFYQTGNDIGTGVAALGDAFVKLHGDGTSLAMTSHYQPPFAGAYKDGDTDLGSGGPMLLPGGKLIGGGKDGQFFVLSQSDLAAGPTSFQAFYNTFHFGPGAYPYNSPPVYPTHCPPASIYGVANEGQPCYIDVADYKNGESFGPNIHAGPVFWRTSASRGLVFKMAEKDYLKSFAYDVAAGTVGATPTAVATVRPAKDGMPGGFSSVSADKQRNGIVWTVVQQDNSMTGYPKPAVLYAHNAANLRELWNNSADRVVLAKFNAPTIADGRVVLPSLGLFQVYGSTLRRRAGLATLPLDAAIETKWANTGGAQGLLGHAKGERQRDQQGLRQDFETLVAGGGFGQISVPPSVKFEIAMCDSRTKYKPNLSVAGSIFASRKTGAHFVMGEIRDRFLQSGGTKRFGYPITDEVPTPDGFGLMTRFERGTIFWYPGRNAEIGEPKTPPLHVIPMKAMGPRP